MAYPQIPTAIDRKTRIKIAYEPQAARPVAERIKDSREVHLPLTPEQAMREASRCLQCPMAPCVKACPAGNDIPGALRKIEQGDFLGAAEIYRRTSSLAQICGRVCPQDQLCQGSCVRNKTDGPVLCGALEAFVADFEREQNPFRIVPDAPSATPVAVVGSGPAGLVCAEQLVIRGYRVTVFEAAAAPGGMLTYGIPGFKMDPAVVRSLVEDLRHAGVEFRFGTKIGKSLTVDDLFADGFQAVFLGTGAAVPTGRRPAGGLSAG
jgi:glutamate synthase (NADPH/NADH) small chain